MPRRLAKLLMSIVKSVIDTLGIMSISSIPELTQSSESLNMSLFQITSQMHLSRLETIFGL